MRYHNVSADQESEKTVAPSFSGSEESIEVNAMYKLVVNFMNLSD